MYADSIQVIFVSNGLAFYLSVLLFVLLILHKVLKARLDFVQKEEEEE
jgi:hypothetical protein